MRKHKGFTLIELMMVLLIIALLAALFIPRFTRIKYQAHFYSCEMNEKNLATALETYSANDINRAYPATGQLDILRTGGFINTMPSCPTNPGVIYSYERVEQIYTISCSGSHASIGVPLTYPKFSNRIGGFIIEP